MDLTPNPQRWDVPECLPEVVQRRWAAIRALQPTSTFPWMMVTPLGLSQRKPLEQALTQLGVAIAQTVPLTTWPDITSLLYGHQRWLRDRADWESDPSAAAAGWQHTLAYETIWSQEFPNQRGECWLLKRWEDYHALAAVKRAHRRLLTPREGWAVTSNLCWRVHLHPYHVPDWEHLPYETAAILKHAFWA